MITKTHCGSCNASMIRTTRKARWINRKDAIYACVNPDCDYAVSICIEFAGETGAKGNFSKRNKQLYGSSDLGNTYTISKKAIETMYEKEGE